MKKATAWLAHVSSNKIPDSVREWLPEGTRSHRSLMDAQHLKTGHDIYV